MYNKFLRLVLLLLVGFIVSCNNDPKKQEQASIDVDQYSSKLNDWFEEQFNEDVQRSPMTQTYLGIKTEDYG